MLHTDTLTKWSRDATINSTASHIYKIINTDGNEKLRVVRSLVVVVAIIIMTMCFIHHLLDKYKVTFGVLMLLHNWPLDDDDSDTFYFVLSRVKFMCGAHSLRIAIRNFFFHPPQYAKCIYKWIMSSFFLYSSDECIKRMARRPTTQSIKSNV